MGTERLREQLLTVPNLVTALRLACLPVFCWLLFGLGNRAGAGLLLGALGATDWVDGYLARRLGQATSFGAVFDPTADRLLFFTAVISMLVDGNVALWFGIVALLREFIVSAGVIFVAAKGVSWLGVNFWGKTGSFGLMFAFPLFLIGSSSVAGAGAWTVAGWVWGIPSLLAAWYGAYLYVSPARAALRDLRRRASEPPPPSNSATDTP